MNYTQPPLKLCRKKKKKIKGTVLHYIRQGVHIRQGTAERTSTAAERGLEKHHNPNIQYKQRKVDTEGIFLCRC